MDVKDLADTIDIGLMTRCAFANLRDSSPLLVEMQDGPNVGALLEKGLIEVLERDYNGCAVRIGFTGKGVECYQALLSAYHEAQR